MLITIYHFNVSCPERMILCHTRGKFVKQVMHSFFFLFFDGLWEPLMYPCYFIGRKLVQITVVHVGLHINPVDSDPRFPS